MRGRLLRLGIPFEQGTPGEGVNLTDEDEASSAARRPSPGTRLPPSTPEVWHEWGSYKRARGERRDGRLEPGGRDAERGHAVPARVQDLERDLPALGVDRRRDGPVGARRAAAREPRAERRQPALDVRREPARHDEPDPAARALREVGGEAWEVAGPVLEPGVHRAHEDAVPQRREPEVERGEE